MSNWGIQNELPPDGPPWYANYFELRAVLASGSRERSDPPFNYLKELEVRTLPIRRDYQRYLLTYL